MYNQKLKIPWPEFGDSVRLVLMEFSDEVNAKLTKAAQRAATRTRAEIQRYAPKRSGTYAKTWTVKKDTTYKSRPSFIVHAKSPGYQLAHLLERSHRIVNDYGEYGVTNGYPHVEPAWDQNIRPFEDDVKKIFKDLS